MIVQKNLPHDTVQRLDRVMTTLWWSSPQGRTESYPQAHFHLDGHINKQNCRYTIKENPRELHQKPLHSQKVTIWCALSKVGIIWPYFFKLSVDIRWRWIQGDMRLCYRAFFIPYLKENVWDIPHAWFQQDITNALTSREFQWMSSAKK